MLDVVKVASYLCKRYKEETGNDMDEMKLHKLLYFTQRECIIVMGEPMFPEQFSAWKYGPVMVSIRERYKNGTLNEELSKQELEKYMQVFNSVFENYAKDSSWSLSVLSHGETSWRNAHKGVAQDENSSELMKTEDIGIDAKRIKMRRFYFDRILPGIYGKNN